jgi:DNA-binding transcriptional MerR regulator
MRIAELSERSGVPVPTIKYYLREGLLPPGRATRPNQAAYDEQHVQRLRLVRVLLDIGRMPIAAIRELLTDLDRPDPDLHFALGRALKATSGVGRPTTDDDAARADREVDALLERRGWQVSPEAPARRRVAEVIATLRQLGADSQVDRIDDYAAAVEAIADVDLALIKDREPAAMVYRAVVGTILGDALIVGLRRMAQESASAKIFGHRLEEGLPPDQFSD